MKHVVWAILDKKDREPWRPAFAVARQPQIIENGVLKQAEAVHFVEWAKGKASSPVSAAIRDDNPCYGTIVEAMKVYAAKIGPYGQTVLGPFEAPNASKAIDAALAALIDNRELSVEERLAVATIKASEAEKKLSDVLAETEKLKTKLALQK